MQHVYTEHMVVVELAIDIRASHESIPRHFQRTRVRWRYELRVKARAFLAPANPPSSRRVTDVAARKGSPESNNALESAKDYTYSPGSNKPTWLWNFVTSGHSEDPIPDNSFCVLNLFIIIFLILIFFF